MTKPVLLIVDDDPQVLAAVRRDQRSRYREHYTVMSAASGQEALATARELKSRGDSLAMLISDQRMPGMLGSEVLAKSREVYPLSRRVLLTAYSDVEAAIKAINEALWDIENRTRAKEAAQLFDDEFIALTRSVYQNNDKRAVIKRQINELLNSGLVEEKQYTSYKV